jgi:hypothetical protein
VPGSRQARAGEFLDKEIVPMQMRLSLGLVACALLGLQIEAQAEPYLAVRSGQKCASCHVNPAGGGKRTVFGNVYGQNQLSRQFIPVEDDAVDYLNGEITKWLAIGGNFRGSLDYIDVPNRDSQSEFEVDRATIYAELRLIPNLLTLYLDEQVAPGGATSREAFALFTPNRGRYTVKAGKFFLPYGLRIEDDSAFIRQASGINFDTPDKGLEAGLELGPWSAQVAITNGTAGGAENDSDKQYSLLATYVNTMWRVGASFNFNDADVGDRQMQNVFFGLRTGPIAWLAEVDYVQDEGTPTGDRDQWAGLIEGNWLVTRGHNLKLTYEFLDPDDDVDEDEQTRYSLVWEYSPFQFAQARAGVRLYDGIPQNDLQNRDEVFIQLHVYF